MADDFDVEAMLEAPFRREDDGSSSRGKDKDREKGRDRDRKKKHDDKDRERRRSRSRDRERHRHKERRHKRSKSRSHSRERRKKERKNRSRSRSPRLTLKLPKPQLSPAERDARTVFVMQLSVNIKTRDLQEMFSAVGKVRDVRLISDNKTRRSKGIAYIEFAEIESVPLALGLHGQRLLGVPIIVQVSQAEKNRAAQAQNTVQKGTTGPMRLYVGSLHFNITEDMLRGIFEPFGKIQDVSLIRNHETGKSMGYGFITFTNSDEAKKALDQLNGFELAGRPMKVGHVTERTDASGNMVAPGSLLDNDEMDRAGIDLGATGRLQLMAKLAEGTGFEIPQVAANALNMVPNSHMLQQPQITAPPIATQCFMLSNMFDPANESSPSWETEIRDDVIEECNKHGGVLHIYVDKASPQGNVYVKCPSISAAVASVQALHGRWFAGKMITAAYVPLPNYHQLFVDSVRAVQLLMPSTQSVQAMHHVGLMPGMPPPQPHMAGFH